jgi:hypothetical protein
MKLGPADKKRAVDIHHHFLGRERSSFSLAFVVLKALHDSSKSPGIVDAKADKIYRKDQSHNRKPTQSIRQYY